MTHITDYIKVYDFLDQVFCNETIQYINSLEWRKHSYNDPSTGKNITHDYDLSVTSDDMSYYSLILFKKLYNIIPRYFNDLGMPNMYVGHQPIRYNRYDVGTKMNVHADHIHTLFDGNKKGIPILSLLGFLNDDYEGGDFILCGKKIITKPGQLIIFPSNFVYPHEVTTVTKGTRYSYVSWSF